MDADVLAFNPEAGVAETIEAGVRRILAPNPSPMTFRGTNTYVVGTKDLVVIDPGPDMSQHLDAILSSVGPDQQIKHIVVTHAHVDHSPLAHSLAQHTGAKVSAFGGPTAGRSDVMQSLAVSGLAGGGEGVDHTFVPDVLLAEGDIVQGSDWQLEVIHTPGHFGSHICLAWEGRLFCGDHVMGWASSLVSPPDGDLTDFMHSCRKLQKRPWQVFFPGHGAPITAPHVRLNWLIAHRQSREHSILEALEAGPATAAQLAASIYADTPAALLLAAERNVFAHLIDLKGKKQVSPQGSLSAQAVFEKT